MIRMVQSSSSAHAKAYFSDALQKTDYYLNDQELQGQFFGRLAERMGIKKEATKDVFFALCENINPASGEQLTLRNRDDRTVGYDINFHCPKSVSVINALSGDNHIIAAFQASVYETMKDIEADSMTRVRKNGAYEDRKTGELAWAEFTHQTARPVDGSVPDPHLHSHCFVFNATWDAQEKEIKAGQFRDIKRDMPYYQARFHKILSDKLIDLGYQIKRTNKSFEIEGVPKGVVGLFSKRTNEIGQFAKEHGITDAKAMSELGARTRSKKQKGLTMAELKTEWVKQINEEVIYEPQEADKAIRFAPKKEAIKAKAVDCIDYAVNHAFERASVMPDRRLLETAYKQSIGNRSIALDDITNEFLNETNIIFIKDKYRTYCTTHEVLIEEKQMVDLARQGQGKMKPLFNDVPVMQLEGQQAEAIAHILTTPHQVSIIRGAAGSGKTKVMTEASNLINKADKKLFVVAPTTQAREVLIKENFANAETVAKLLIDKKLQSELYNQVLWVDEAGLLGTKDMKALIGLAVEQKARLILGGDTRQHASVVRGDALRILNTVGEIKTAEVSKIYRQRNSNYRAIVEDLAKGNIKGGFDKLDSIGAIKNVDPLNPNEELVSDYINTVKKGKSALIVSPTHQQGDAVTDIIRSKLKAAGVLGKKELKAAKFINTNMTEAQKTDWRNFEDGQIIQFNQNVPQIKRGTIWAVKDITETVIKIENPNKEHQILPLDKPTAYDVFKPSEIGLVKGDKVKITRNSFDLQNKRLNNGQSFEVSKVNKSGKVVLINGQSKSRFILDKDFGHITHDYCTTSHSAQGKTVDEVFISQPSSTFTATDAKQFYVSVSRGRDNASIYTDDRIALLEYASEVGDRQSALELVGNHNAHIEHVEMNERASQLAKQKAITNETKQFKNRDYEPEL
ncbi:relaxase domain-containing protein [Mucilaginibacter sp. HMF5004]|uniref:MobF family relaxase n=1 Tax=Mucilaginibacter rivuli TaxID=2857527 RepID=UPI001C5ECF2C|nr:MobF family relaxase [Mucilaginibacter rivuli]MBW4889202.1 relaxase domain-containing protein [Mucilaginibacter rivuli]